MVLDRITTTARKFEKSRILARHGKDVIERTFPNFCDDVEARMRELSAAGIGQGSVLGICAANCYDWLVLDVATAQLGIVLHVFTCRPEMSWAQASIHYGLRAAFTDEGNGHRIVQVAERGGSESGATQFPPPSEQVLSRVYSSGTSGYQKGLEIRRLGVRRAIENFLTAYDVNSDDAHLIFLPLSNFQQRATVLGCLISGASFMLSSPATVMEDLGLVQPTFLISPPAFYVSLARSLESRYRAQDMADRLASLLGGRIRFMITGMAPIPVSILQFFERCGMSLYEAYGVTEIGMVSWNRKNANHMGTVGMLVEGNELSFGADAEILVRPAVPLSQGYFDTPQSADEEVFLPDGFIRTGDIGHLVGEFLVLSGRKKDVIVTSGGLKFHPQEVEGRLSRCSRVQQCAVVSSPTGEITAVVYAGPANERVSSREVVEYVAEVNASLDLHKRIQRTVFSSTPFSADNGLLTRNLKLNRKAIARLLVHPSYAEAR